MALPTQKRSKSRKRIRQYQYRLKKKNLSTCPKCKKPILPHHACPFCGYYAGRQVIETSIEKKKKKKEKKEKQEKEKK